MDNIQPSMDLNAHTPSPLKRKQSVSPDTPSQQAPKRPRLDSQARSIEDSLASTRHYGVYQHNPLGEPNSAGPQLLTTSTDLSSAYKAMRKPVAEKIDANARWGATRELQTNHFYEILDSTSRVVLRYELDTVFPAGKDSNDDQMWIRADEVYDLPVHYGLYVNMHCDAEERAERFFIGEFGSIGEANHAMKQSAATCIGNYSGVKLSEKCIEMLSEEGQVLQRYTVETGRRNAYGRFIREVDLQQLELGGSDLKTPVVRPSTPEKPESLPQPPPQHIIAHTIPELVRQATPKAASPAPPISPSQTPAAESTRRSSRRLNAEPQSAATDKKEEQPKIQTKTTSPPKPKTPEARSKAKAKAKAQAQTEAPVDLTLHCTCRQPDDGSFMIGCDNDACPIGWYHGRCIGLRKVVSEDQRWYCEMCTREMEGKKGMDAGAGAGPGKAVKKKAVKKTPAKRRGGGSVKAKAKTNKSS